MLSIVGCTELVHAWPYNHACTVVLLVVYFFSFFIAQVSNQSCSGRCVTCHYQLDIGVLHLILPASEWQQPLCFWLADKFESLHFMLSVVLRCILLRMHVL